MAAIKSCGGVLIKGRGAATPCKLIVAPYTAPVLVGVRSRNTTFHRPDELSPQCRALLNVKFG